MVGARRATVALLLVCAATRAQNTATTDAGKLRLVLPRIIYAVANVETNIYFDNVVLTTDSSRYVFDVKCEKGLVYGDRWAYTPTAQEAGTFALTLEVRDETNAIVASGESTLEVVSAAAGAGAPVTLLAVGDSLTQASIYTERLLELAGGADGPALTLIGSRGPDNAPSHGANRHEGYSGWTAEAFATFYGPLARSGEFKGRETGSPFVYDRNAPRLDFATYCAQFNHGKAPDFVTFALGTNDIFYASDQNIDATIDRILGYFDSLVAMVHGFNASTRVGIVLVIPPAATQDGFRNYRATQRQTRWQYRRNQHRMLERMLAHYGGREAENLYLIPAYINLDAAHNFPTRPASWNADNPDQPPRVIDGIHPASAGYRQIGDTIYCWLKDRLFKSPPRREEKPE
jgi:lysophospholipase L1-like esterase